MQEIKVNKEVVKEMKEFNEIAIGPNSVSGCILKKCKQEMAGPIHI